MLLIGTGTEVDDLAGELVGGELERAPRDQAVTLIQLVAPDLLVLAADCATDGGLGVLAELASAGVTRDLRVLVFCGPDFKASGSQSTFRHVVCLPPQGGAKVCATRIKAVLARLTMNGSEQEPLQQIVDAVCGAQTKQIVAAAQSLSPRGAFGGRAQPLAVAASPAKTATKTAQLAGSASKTTASKATAGAKPQAPDAGIGTPAAKNPVRPETASRSTPLSAAKQSAVTVPLSVFTNTTQTTQLSPSKPGPVASRNLAQSAGASRQPETARSNVAQPALASAQPKAEWPSQAAQSPTEQHQSPEAELNTRAQTQAQPSPFGPTRAKAASSSATMMQWPTSGQPVEAAKPQFTQKLNSASPPVERPVGVGPWHLVGKLPDASRSKPETETASPALEVAVGDLDAREAPSAATQSSRVGESPALDVELDDFDTHPPPAAPVQSSRVGESPASDVELDDFDMDPPSTAAAKQGPVSVNPALELVVEDFDTRPTPAPLPQSRPRGARATLDVAAQGFDTRSSTAVPLADAQSSAAALAAPEDSDATLTVAVSRRPIAGLMRWLAGGDKVERPLVAVTPFADPTRSRTARRMLPPPLMMVAIVLVAVGVGSAWGLLQKRGASSAGQALLLNAVNNRASSANENTPASGASPAPSRARELAAKAAQDSQTVAPGADPVADLSAEEESSAVQPVASPGLTQAQALVEEGLQLFKDGRLGLAEAAYLKALKLGPNNPRAMAGLVRVHIKRGDGVEAVRWAVALCAAQPNRGQNHTLLGDAWALRDNEPAARSAWNLAARLGDPIARKRLQQ